MKLLKPEHKNPKLFSVWVCLNYLGDWESPTAELLISQIVDTYQVNRDAVEVQEIVPLQYAA